MNTCVPCVEAKRDAGGEGREQRRRPEAGPPGRSLRRIGDGVERGGGGYKRRRSGAGAAAAEEGVRRRRRGLWGN
jgi:hypothetical protein